ncbi:Fc.00g100940.m01.CDS01 [Cosmosporella sp. VM-42]
MATRQDSIDAQAKHLEQVQKEHPEVDFKEMAAGMVQNIHFEFDVKACHSIEVLGNDTWRMMNSALSNRLDNSLKPDAQAALADARGYLDGNKDLQDRFDAIFKNVNNETVALAKDISAKAAA